MVIKAIVINADFVNKVDCTNFLKDFYFLAKLDRSAEYNFMNNFKDEISLGLVVEVLVSTNQIILMVGAFF